MKYIRALALGAALIVPSLAVAQGGGYEAVAKSPPAGWDVVNRPGTLRPGPGAQLCTEGGACTPVTAPTPATVIARSRVGAVMVRVNGQLYMTEPRVAFVSCGPGELRMLDAPRPFSCTTP